MFILLWLSLSKYQNYSTNIMNDKYKWILRGFSQSHNCLYTILRNQTWQICSNAQTLIPIVSCISGGSRIFQMGGRCFVANGGAHILFSGKKCMKLKEIGLKWGGARLLAPCYSKITIFLWIILNSIMKTSYFTYLRIFWDILYKIIF